MGGGETRARSRGARPAGLRLPAGFISGHSKTGASNPRDLLGAILSESLRLGAAPEIEGWLTEMTPVDFVAAAILDIASKIDAVGANYHLANPDLVPAGTVFDWLEDGGCTLGRVSHEEWSRRLGATPPGDEGGPGGVLRGALPGPEGLTDGNVCDVGNTRRVLGEGGSRRPELDGDLIRTYARCFAAQGWAPAPAALQNADRRG